MGEDEPNWRIEFEKLGEHEVRRRLRAESTDRWADPVNRYAGRWLDHLAKNAEARQHAITTEQTQIQRQAAVAAEDAVSQARAANALAREANNVARDANSLSATSNSIAEAANNLARRANDNARYAWIASAISAAAAILALVLRR